MSQQTKKTAEAANEYIKEAENYVQEAEKRFDSIGDKQRANRLRETREGLQKERKEVERVLGNGG